MELRISSVWALERVCGMDSFAFFLSFPFLPEVETSTGLAYLTSELGAWIIGFVYVGQAIGFDQFEQQQLLNMYESLTIIILCICCISIMSTSFVIISYIRYKQLRVTEFNYILYICFADLMFALIVLSSCIFHFAQITYNDFFCQFQATIKVFFATQEFVWTGVVCYTLKESVFSQRRSESMEKKRHWRWLITCTTFSLALCLIPLIDGTYGPVQPLRGTNCFVDLSLANTRNYETYQLDWTSLGIFYIPLWISFVYNLYCIISVVKKIKLEDQKRIYQQQINALYMYPSVFFFCWIWISIDRILAIFAIYETVEMAYIDYAFTCLNGFCNAMIYASTQIRNRTPIERDLRQILCGREITDSFTSTTFQEMSSEDSRISNQFISYE